MTITFTLDGKTRYVTQMYAHTLGHSVDPKRARTDIRVQDLGFIATCVSKLGGTDLIDAS